MKQLRIRFEEWQLDIKEFFCRHKEWKHENVDFLEANYRECKRCGYCEIKIGNNDWYKM